VRTASLFPVISMKHSFIRAIAASALLLVASTAANAQAATQSGAAESAATEKWAAMPVGVYQLLVQLPEQPLPATLTIKEGMGEPVATFQAEGEQNANPVKVTVKGTELYVNGTAPKGAYEIVLTRKGAEIAGRWTYGGDTGKLTGKVE
jgi:hypothetical protein